MRWRIVGALLAVLVVGGCEKTDENKPMERVDAAASDPAIDPDLARALGSSAASPGQQPAEGEAGGPPPTGVLGPGEADKEHAKGAPPAVALGNAGSQPRFTITPAVPAPGAKFKGTLRTAMRTGQRSVLPTIDFELAFEAAKAEEGAPAGPVAVVAKVTKADLAPTQPVQMTDDAKKAIAKLKGGEVRWSVLPNGGTVSYSYAMPKGTDGSQEPYLRSLAESLITASIPVPNEPVGRGAFWMVKSREQVSGTDMLSYRLVTVDAIDANSVEVTLATKRYAAGNAINLAGVQGATALEIDQIKATGEGRVRIQKDLPFSPKADLTDTIIIALRPAGQTGQNVQRMTFPLEAHTIFELAGAKVAAPPGGAAP